MGNNNGTQPSIAIIGSGFSGLGLAIRLVRAGYDNLRIYEKRDDVGGVWRDNTYPGAACDAPSHLYSYSFHPKPDWSRRFAEQPEILAYLRECAEHYGLLSQIRFDTEIVTAEYDADQRHWVLTDRGGAVFTADVLVTACGQLSVPSYPPIPGLHEFSGVMFHSARWDHDHDLTGRAVAVIGNGASAIQFVPHVAERARSLTIFQRQAHWISPKPDHEYPRLRRRLNLRIPLLHKLPRAGVFVWFEMVLNPMLVSRYGRKLLSFPIRLWCRWNLRKVAEPRLRARLTPDYEIGCNRILTSNDYYQTLNRDDTHVVTDAVTRIEDGALITEDGRSHPVDTIILATGFRSHDFVAPMRVIGLDGTDLVTAWDRRPRAYLGLSVPGFPNLFLMYGPNTNVGSGSIVHMLESQMNYIIDALDQMRHRGGYLDLRPEVLDRFDAKVQDQLATTVWSTGGCNSWYIARTARGPANTNNWPESMRSYRRRTRRLDPTLYRTAPAPGPRVENPVAAPATVAGDGEH
ncbi:flavin-containing monooxygenase [Nocardia arizonensis]|uniref:flavin-containing monooxygenase n=1 Tax=Nocardia arizonensis TaxID=1141647 RepID=UPI0009E9CBE1|nr:NAD(P)/FAD-dependent oxidoreductase [Nocardia arizonensis]